MQLALQAYRMGMHCTIEQLTPEIIEKLQKAFEKDYPGVRPGPAGLLIFNEGLGRSIFIGPDRLVVSEEGREGRAIQPDFERHQVVLERLRRVFSLNADCRLLHQFITIFPVTHDALETSREEFTSVSGETLAQVMPEVLAVGLRFVLRFDDLQGEFRVEPHLEDPRFMALIVEVGTVSEVSIDRAAKLGEAVSARLLQTWAPFVYQYLTAEMD